MTKTQREVMVKAFEKLAEAARAGSIAALDSSTTPIDLIELLECIEHDSRVTIIALTDSIAATVVLNVIEGGAK